MTREKHSYKSNLTCSLDDYCNNITVRLLSENTKACENLRTRLCNF